MKTVGPQHELFIITEGANGPSREDARISQTGRATQGVKMMSVDEGDRVTAVARMDSEKKDAASDEDAEPEDLAVDAAASEADDAGDARDGEAAEGPLDE